MGGSTGGWRRGALALALVVAVAGFGGSVRAQGTPPLDPLVEQAPAGAQAVQFSTFNLGGYSDAALGYTLNMSVDLLGNGARTTLPQQVFGVYRYENDGWDEVVDGNQLGLDTFNALPNAATLRQGLGHGLSGPMMAFTATPLPAHANMPDLLALEFDYSLPPGNAAFAAIAILQPNDAGYTVLYSTSFKARGRVDAVYATADGIAIDAAGQLPNDPACCPNGTEFVHLVLPADGTLAEAERCTKPGRYVAACA
jgi:hypothetical protein